MADGASLESAATTAVPSAPAPPVTTIWRSRKSIGAIMVCHCASLAEPTSCAGLAECEMLDAGAAAESCHSAPGGNRWLISISPSSAAASTEPGSPATPPAGVPRRADRAERPRLGHLVGVIQAHSRRAALSGALRISPGARGAAEREVLLRAAPHLIRPLRFVLPMNEARRSPRCFGSASCFMTGSAGARSCPAPANSTLSSTKPASRCAAVGTMPSNIPIVSPTTHGWSCSTRSMPRTGCGDPHADPLRARGTERYLAACPQCPGPARRRDGADPRQCHRRVAWILCRKRAARRAAARSRLDKGSHIVVRKLYDHDRAYILQAADGRVVFAIPFENDYTLIGTTDRAFAGDPAR